MTVHPGESEPSPGHSSGVLEPQRLNRINPRGSRPLGAATTNEGAYEVSTDAKTLRLVSG